jgi:hypothetical protein
MMHGLFLCPQRLGKTIGFFHPAKTCRWVSHAMSLLMLTRVRHSLMVAERARAAHQKMKTLLFY